MNKIRQLIIIAIFLIFIVVFTVISIVKTKSDFSVAENRALQELPDVDGQAILDGDFQKEYEDYLSDQFVNRPFFVTVKTRLQLMFGKKDFNGVYLGKDDYLLEKYQDSDFKRPLVYGNIDILSSFLTQMKNQFGEDHVRCMMVPSKGTVLKNKLPKYATSYDTTYVVEELALDHDVIDLETILKKHQDEYIYYRTDHHWTTLGAYYAYQAYKNSIGGVANDKNSYKIENVSKQFLGTTFDKVQWKTKSDTVEKWTDASIKDNSKLKVTFDEGDEIWDGSYYDESALEKKDKYAYFLGGNTAKIQIDTGAKTGKTLLLLKDSYSNCFVPFLQQDYDHIYMLDLRYCQDSVVDMIQKFNKENKITDVLIMYNVEKFMNDKNLDLLEMQDE